VSFPVGNHFRRCRSRRFHGGESEGSVFLGQVSASLDNRFLTFRRNTVPSRVLEKKATQTSTPWKRFVSLKAQVNLLHTRHGRSNFQGYGMCQPFFVFACLIFWAGPPMSARPFSYRYACSTDWTRFTSVRLTSRTRVV
jgi:hypothetical protein